MRIRGGGFRSYRYVPFGLSNAPAWASAISSELCDMFRAAGVLRCNAYIDDVICMGETREECQRHLDTILRVCSELGVGVKASKVQKPSTDVLYLGIRIQTEKSMLSIDPDMCKRLLQDIKYYCANPCISRSALNSLCGGLSWVAQIMHGARTRMRVLWDTLRSHPSGPKSKLSDDIVSGLSCLV